MLCLVVALAAEARPLLASLHLQGVSGHPYRICAGEQTHLIVSGIGKVAAAAATAYLRALIGDTPAAWLNIGIAGHGSQAVGTALLAHKVVDAASGKPFYPTFTASPPCRTTLLHTVDHAQPPVGDAAYDMEASGFCEAAQRFATSERIHCLKIVSDNPQFPYQTLNAEKIEALIEAQLDTAAQVGEHLRTLSQQLHALHADPPGLAELTRPLAIYRHATAPIAQLARALADAGTSDPCGQRRLVGLEKPRRSASPSSAAARRCGVFPHSRRNAR